MQRDWMERKRETRVLMALMGFRRRESDGDVEWWVGSLVRCGRLMIVTFYQSDFAATTTVYLCAILWLVEQWALAPLFSCV